MFNILRLAAITALMLLAFPAAAQEPGCAVTGCIRAASTPARDAPMEIKGAKTVDANGVIDLISMTPGLVIVDNRKQADFDSGHIEGAVRILDTDMTAEAVLAGAVKSKATPVLFYCNGLKCGRAAVATTKALDWGYSQVYYYALGIHDWKDKRLPLVTR